MLAFVSKINPLGGGGIMPKPALNTGPGGGGGTRPFLDFFDGAADATICCVSTGFGFGTLTAGASFLTAATTGFSTGLIFATFGFAGTTGGVLILGLMISLISIFGGVTVATATADFGLGCTFGLTKLFLQLEIFAMVAATEFCPMFLKLKHSQVAATLAIAPSAVL